MKKILTTLLLGLISCVTFSQIEKPNIVVFIADDAGMDFGCYGNNGIKTPNIDQLAKSGLKCTNAFLTAPQCSPSRTSILSGQFAHTIGTEDLHIGLDATTKILPSYLKDAGYFTGLMKKGHLGENGYKQFDWYDMKLHSSEGWYQKAVNYFNEFVETSGDRPFFLWVGFTDPHRPYAEGHLVNDRASRVNNVADVSVPPYLIDSKVTRRDLADYYDEISRMDEHIGGMVNVLEKKQLLKNTLIIFLSDNGMPFPRAKGTLYDSGTKTPLIFYWEDKIPNSIVYDGLISSIDITPSILDICGIEKPVQMVGKSLKEIFKDQSLNFNKYIYSERNWHNADEHMRAIRSKDYLLILNSYTELPHGTPSDLSSSPSWYELMREKKNRTLSEAQSWLFTCPRNSIELYDVKTDPFQINNLSGKEEYLSIGKELVKQLVEWMLSTKDHPPNMRRRHDVVDRISGYPIANGMQRDFYKEYWGD